MVTAVQQRCSLKDDMFPIIIGRRPNSGLNDSGKFSTTSIGTGSDDHNSSNGTDRPPTVRLLDISTLTTRGQLFKTSLA